jgi:hypothetical protein
MNMSAVYRTAGLRSPCEVCEVEEQASEIQVFACGENVYVCNTCRLALVFEIADDEAWTAACKAGTRWNAMTGHQFSFGLALSYIRDYPERCGRAGQKRACDDATAPAPTAERCSRGTENGVEPCARGGDRWR